MSAEVVQDQHIPRLVLGVDPGIAALGYGLVTRHGDNLQTVAFGVIGTTSEDPVAVRLQTLYDELRLLLERHQPDAMAVETLFFCKNTRSALSVGQARGVAILAAAHSGLLVGEYTPLQVKLAITGYGRADKTQMQRMICMLLGLNCIPEPDDAADALAVAICHLHTIEKTSVIQAWSAR